MKLKQQQRGLTFMGLLIVGILLAFTGVIVAQVVPTYIEYTAVQKAVQKASAGTTVTEVRSIFDKAARSTTSTPFRAKTWKWAKRATAWWFRLPTAVKFTWLARLTSP
jgi:Tfp pilus assembly protein PilE